MPQRTGKKILIYFFLLILAGSVNNISLSNIKLYTINNIKVTGLSDTENSIIVRKLKDLKLKNIFFINSDQIKKIINLNTLVEKYTVYKNYPSTLEIKIIKTKFLAKINNDGRIFLVGSNGKLSMVNNYKNELPYIFGKPEINEFLEFKKVIDQSKFRYDQIEKFYFFPSRRWDLELKDKVVLKLPEKLTKDYLDYIFEILINKNLNNIRLIDARIKNQIILND
ncbi:FtsQ-type POTRA domain-containing protein [Candidatus Pelagibacter sp.]|nr:FtsQ-type POTRA domain-containing protein [Candidatus Pelagibacter sp.]|tara:strand:- start:136 stop:807 length:672 start_codon:yes stop_codon:yes gene_type:complete